MQSIGLPRAISLGALSGTPAKELFKNLYLCQRNANHDE